MENLKIPVSQKQLSLLKRIAKADDRRLEDLINLVFSTGLEIYFCERAICFDKDQNELSNEEKKLINPLGLLTNKPIIYATNLSEDELSSGNSFSEQIELLTKNEGAQCVKISAQVEAELIELGEEERKDYVGFNHYLKQLKSINSS